MVQGPRGGQAWVKRVLEEVITRVVTAGATCRQAQLPPGQGGLAGWPGRRWSLLVGM